MLIVNCFDEHANVIKFQLKDDSELFGTLANSVLSLVDKIAIVFDDDSVTGYNSTDNPNEISYTDAGVVVLSLGDTDLSIGSHTAHLDIYYIGQSTPIRWEPDIRIRKN